MKAITELLGERVLFKRHGQTEVNEGYVQEFSRDKKYVCVNFLAWLPTAEITVIEVLPKRKLPAAFTDQPDPAITDKELPVAVGILADKKALLDGKQDETDETAKDPNNA